LALIPLLAVTMKNIALNHRRSGHLAPWKTVPAVRLL
jgi:hypothetical protein